MKQGDFNPPSGSKLGRIFLGVVVGDLAGLALIGLVAEITRRFGGGSILPSLVLIPMAMGIAMAWVWRPLPMRTSGVLLYCFFCTFFGLLFAALFMGEGVICLIVISPVIYGFLVAGTLLGQVFFRIRDRRIHAIVLPAIAVMIVTEPSLREPHTGVVIDEIHIAAPPAKVWPHLLAFPTIPEKPDYWLFRLGLPYPVATTNSGNFAGADRACIFSGGAVFKERIAEFEPERVLTFDIVESPHDPELLGHLDAHRGQFFLRANSDGTTTLIGSTWYTLHVSPAAYFDWWTRQIFREVHLRVMRNAKRLAETPPAS